MLEISKQIDEIEEWLTRNGWAKKRELPDHMAANIRHPYLNNISLADMVYKLIELNNQHKIRDHQAFINP